MLSTRTEAVPETDALTRWLATRGGRPFEFQKQTWEAYLAGHSGLVHAPTGSGKTLAVFGGPVLERLEEPIRTTGRGSRDLTEPFRLIWITPMRALASDTAHALSEVVRGLDLNWSVELRTSDTTATTRKKQSARLPTVLVTTPESLSLLLSYADSAKRVGGVRCAIVDEWHELLSTKRGVQAELGIARLRTLNPGLRIWGLSATIGNLSHARDALLGADAPNGVPIHAQMAKEIVVESLIPESIERFPWGGHMGLRMLGPVLDAIQQGGSTLVFANTRSQSETWFRAIQEKRPEWVGQIAIHHGSLDRKLRFKVEQMLRDGTLRAVVCTSSLDLGVDFAAVDRVIQLGSPKGVARLMQRAGRSGHRPGEVSRVICAPTHAFELIEFSAAREAIEHRRIESRVAIRKPLDLLVQHLVTIASGGGFDEASLKAELRSTHAFADLTDEEWRWAMDFVERGGPSLTAYPNFARVKRDAQGRWQVASDKLARLHRLGIGTITGDGVVALVTTGGKKLGTMEESFMGRLRPGDFFIFAGYPLVMVGMRQMVARVRISPKRQGTVPQWPGGKFPLSTQLAMAVRRRLDEARQGIYVDDEMRRLAPLLSLQARWSRLPAVDELLIESTKTREGHHHFLFGFLGRLVNEGLGAVMSYRLKRRYDAPVTATYNDYGIELLCPAPLELDEPAWREILSTERLVEDLLACLNSGELTKRQFRDIARVAGLVLATSPGAPRTVRHLQASSELFYEVFRDFDPGNLLLEQAQREVLERQLEINRLKVALESLGPQKLVFTSPKRLSPMAFPIWAQRIGSQSIRIEQASERIERMMLRLEKIASDEES